MPTRPAALQGEHEIVGGIPRVQLKLVDFCPMTWSYYMRNGAKLTCSVKFRRVHLRGGEGTGPVHGCVHASSMYTLYLNVECSELLRITALTPTALTSCLRDQRPHQPHKRVFGTHFRSDPQRRLSHRRRTRLISSPASIAH